MSLVTRVILSTLVAAGAIAYAGWIVISAARKFIGHH